MKGDFSRYTFPHARREHYSGVLMQQGRVQLDADFNEQQAIQQYRAESQAADMIGPCGAPTGESSDPQRSFRITAQGNNLQIGRGHYYVQGVLCENDVDTTYFDQPDLLSPPPPLSVLPTEGAVGLVYLDVWQRHVSALDDDYLREKALDGPDTTTRTKTVWQVKILPLSVNVSAETLKTNLRQRASLGIAAWDSLTAPSSGKLRAMTQGAAENPPQPCVLPASAGYRGLENQLYRVEVHQGGSLAQATFKWSRDNGAVVTTIRKDVDGNTVMESLGPDDVEGFKNGQWVELIHDKQELDGQPGYLTRITITDSASRRVTFDPGLPADLDTLEHPRVRRWDQSGGQAGATGIAIAPAGGSAPFSPLFVLEHGLQIQFSPGTYRTGDYWLIPARTALSEQVSGEAGTIEWPPYPTPDEGNDLYRSLAEHRFCPLAIVRRSGGALVVEDVRLFFPTLTNITASQVYLGPTNCLDLQNARTVQEAIDTLCERQTGGCCTFVVDPEPGWEQQLLNTNWTSAQICFRVGDYPLKTPLVFTGKQSVMITGCGAGTRLLAPSSEMALVFDTCQQVIVRDISAETRATSKHMNGVLTFVNCGDVTVEHAQLTCAPGTRRNATCITVRNDPPQKAEDPDARRFARIRSCKLRVGHLQTGMLLINVARAHVEDNIVLVAERPEEFTSGVRRSDPAYRALMSKQLVANMYLGTTPPSGSTNVTLAVNDVSVHFQGNPAFARLWHDAVLRRAPNVSTPMELATVVKAIADDVIRTAGVLENGPSFVPAFTALAQNDQAVATQGIVVAGSVARDVRILNNVIRDVIEGIHVGVSHTSQAARLPDLAGMVMINGNTVEVTLTSVVSNERHGIYVGNCQSVAIEQNHIEINRNGLLTKIDGIRMWGHYGPRLIVRDNYIVNFTRDIFIVTLNNSESQQWLVADNFAQQISLLQPSASPTSGNRFDRNTRIRRYGN